MADDSTPAGPPPGPGADETQPVAKAEGATQVSPPPTPPPTTPSAPTPGGPSAPKSGGVATPLFVVVAIVAVAAIAFAIFSFLGKNSEADDKKAAQKEAAAANDRADEAEAQVADVEDELAALEEQLGVSEDFSVLLADVIAEATTHVNTLYSCTTTAREFAINEIQGTSTVEQAQAVDDQCAASDQAYDDFFTAVEQLPSE
jgi:uncharacterized protein HemX